MSEGKRFVLLAVVCLLPAVIGLPSAQGGLLRLSTHASDGVNPPTADQLDATLDFSVTGTELTLTVVNLTSENPGVDPELKINELYFNATSNVTGLSLTGVINTTLNKWTLGFLQGGGTSGDGNPHQVNGFGKFDVYLVDGQDSQPHVIDPNETVAFIFDITGTGPFSQTDFTTELSAQVDGHIVMWAAAKFYNGPPEMSAYGAVPEPTTLLLLGLGGLTLLRKRRN